MALKLAQKPNGQDIYRRTKAFSPPHALMPSEDKSHWAFAERSLGTSVEEVHYILLFNKLVWFPSFVTQEMIG